MSLSYNEHCPGCKGVCTCHQDGAGFNNQDLSAISCSLEQPRQVHVEKCQKKNSGADLKDCSTMFDGVWDDTSEMVTPGDGQIRLKLRGDIVLPL